MLERMARKNCNEKDPGPEVNIQVIVSLGLFYPRQSKEFIMVKIMILQRSPFPLTGLLLFSSLLLCSCQSAYYSTMEKLGVHKRDIMIDRVQEARNSQQEAKEQFASALEQFETVLGFQGGSLEEKYDKINTIYEDCARRADDVRSRIEKVEDVSEALFDEWQDELGQYTNKTLRRASEQKLKATRSHYEKLIAAMKRAEKNIQPVLNVFHDQVLYLKHNLNAAAIDSLQNELAGIETDVARLIREMESAIAEADAFISSLEKQ